MSLSVGKVTILHRRLTHYRVPLFECMKALCQERGIDIHLVHGQGSPADRLRKNEGVISWADKVKNKYFKIGGKDLFWQPVSKYLTDSDLFIITQENRILSNYPILLKGLLGQCKVAFWGHGVNFQSDKTNDCREKWKRMWLTKVDWWFAYTDLTVQLITKAGFPVERITGLDNAIDTIGFQKDLVNVQPDLLHSIGSTYLIEDESKVGLFCGSLYQHKKLDFLIQAADLIHEAIPQFRLIVIGDGPSADKIKSACNRRQWAHWVGAKKGFEKASYFKIATVILNPGPVGLHILDSFCAGIPLFTTKSAKHGPEIVYLENGINGFMSGDSVAEYSDSVVSLIKDPERYKQVSDAAIRASKKYSIENMANKFVDGISKCLTTS